MGSVVVAQEQGQDWAAYNGDSCQVIKGIPDNSVGYIIYSPPFSSLYTYSDFAEDMGNCNGDEEFLSTSNILSVICTEYCSRADA